MFVEHPVWNQYQFSDRCFHTLWQQISDMAEPVSAGVSKDGTALPLGALEVQAAVLSAERSLVCVGRKTVTAGRGISSSLLIALS